MIARNPEMADYPLRRRLPVSHSTEIGRVIARFAILEWRLRQIAYLLLEINAKAGRLTVRTPRATDYLTMIEDLMALRNAKTTVNTKRLYAALEELSFRRDALAHGIWLKQPSTRHPVLQVTSRTYSPNPGEKKVKARIDPQAVNMPIARLRETVRAIEAAIKTIEKMGREIEIQLATLPRRSPPP